MGNRLNEAGMPAGVIRHKQKLAKMTPEELRARFKGKSREEVERMERSHVVKPGTYTKHITETFKDFLIRELITEKEDREFHTYSGWRRACKQADQRCYIEGDKDIASAFIRDDNGKPIKGIGEWDGEVGLVYATALSESKDSKLSKKAQKAIKAVKKGKQGDYFFGVKPRNEELHKALLVKKGGRHYDEKSDYKRAAEKQKAKKQIRKDLDD